MSSFHEDEFREPPAPDFSRIGIDADVANLMLGDIATEAPEGYENAGLWGELILEAAYADVDAGGFEALVTDDLRSYLWERLAGQFPEDSIERKITGQFISYLGDNAIQSRGTRSYPNGGWGTYHGYELPPREIGNFVRRKWDYEDAGKAAGAEIDRLKEVAPTASVDELYEISTTLEGALEHRHSLLGEPRRQRGFFDSYSDRDGSGRIDECVFGVTDKEIELYADLANAKMRLHASLEQIIAKTEKDPALQFAVGAKAANLTYLDTVLSELKEHHDTEINDVLEVPSFTTVPVSVYEKWTTGTKITEDVIAVRDWIKENGQDKRYIVRSSAVYSEDGEHTGAGIYESVLLPANFSTSDIYRAMKLVYESTTSERAQEYQAFVGVEHELMGLLVQEVPEDAVDQAGLVTINTVMPGVSQLADYAIEEGIHPLEPIVGESYRRRHTLPLSRSGMHLEFGSDYASNTPQAPRFHVPPDTKIHGLRDIWAATQAALFAETVLGRPVQTELVMSPREYKAYLVQARPLPEDLLVDQPFEGFPDEEEVWYDGGGVGVYNGVEAKVAPSYRLRSIERKATADDGSYTLIAFDSSYAKSKVAVEYANRISALTPEQRKKIICLIEQPPTLDSVSGYGHLETLFSELGVGVIFYDPQGERGRKFVNGQKVKIYSNGYQAKIYGDESDPVYQKYLDGTYDEFDYDDDDDDFDDESVLL